MKSLIEGDFDVVVVGTGPGGNSAALVCARAGLRVLLIEREKLPRRKICGGGLSFKTLQALPVPVESVVERWTSCGWVSYGPGRSLFRQLAKPGAMVCREVFDQYMAERARDAGTVLVEGCAFSKYSRSPDGFVSVETGQGLVRTRVLIGADGVHSSVRRQMFPGVKVPMVPAIEALITPRKGVLEALENGCVFDFGAFEGGYGWIFPKANHLNVGLYRFRRTTTNADLRGGLQRFVTTHPFLKDGRVEDVTGFMIPVKAVAADLAADNVVLVGDAAGIGEAFYGEGIYFAVRSGCEAGAAAVEHLRSGRPLAQYSKRIRALRRDLFYSRFTAASFYRMPTVGFERLARSPFVNDLFAGVITGDVSPGECVAKTIGLAPYWLAQRRLSVGPLPSV